MSNLKTLKIFGQKEELFPQTPIKQTPIIAESVNMEDEVNIDLLPGLTHDDPDYEMRKELMTHILKRNKKLYDKMRNWD